MHCPHCGTICWVRTDGTAACACQSQVVCIVCNTDVAKGKVNRKIVMGIDGPYIIHNKCHSAWVTWNR